jgi:DNA-binding transcriptional regulator GbsR (MarR family)
VAEGNLWKMVSRVLSERERVEIQEAIDAMEQALDDLSERARSSDPQVRSRAQTKQQRVRQLLEVAKLGRRLLDALVERAQVDASALVRVLLGASRG